MKQGQRKVFQTLLLKDFPLLVCPKGLQGPGSSGEKTLSHYTKGMTLTW